MGEKIAFIGYGEAAQAFVEGWGGALGAHAFDTKLHDPLFTASKRAEMIRDNVTVAESSRAAILEATLVLSVVTADQALAAATAAAETLRPGVLYCDLNSVAPETKRAAAKVIEAAGGLYADVAVMAPVRPALSAVPLLVGGPHADVAAASLIGLGFNRVRAIGGEVGRAASVKMIRSVMVKGIEALTVECIVAAEVAGVRAEVLYSLDGSSSNDPWIVRANYHLDRMLVHGLRRAAEMEEVADTLDALGTGSSMTRAAIERQRAIGLLGVAHPPEGIAAKIACILDRKAHAA